jgi:hypothetical protein
MSLDLFVPIFAHFPKKFPLLATACVLKEVEDSTVSSWIFSHFTLENQCYSTEQASAAHDSVKAAIWYTKEDIFIYAWKMGS